jgi:ABC-type multidrug transport system fused ATPase/permease subunit
MHFPSDRFLLSLAGSGRGSANVQTLQACGATPWETSLPSVREAIETGLTPNLNQMSVMGLVSIPGMLTGQILGGTTPFVAAKYQIVIMFFVCSNSILILFMVIVQAVFLRLFDNNKRHHASFRSDLITKRKGGKPKDIVLALFSKLPDVLEALAGRVVTQKKTGDDHSTEDGLESSLEKKPTDAASDDDSPNTFRRVGVISDCLLDSNRNKSQPLLSMAKGAISYGGRPLLSDLNLELRDGEILILTGPSGCGISSYLSALALMQPLEEGLLSL